MADTKDLKSFDESHPGSSPGAPTFFVEASCGKCSWKRKQTFENEKAYLLTYHGIIALLHDHIEEKHK